MVYVCSRLGGWSGYGKLIHSMIYNIAIQFCSCGLRNQKPQSKGLTAAIKIQFRAEAFNLNLKLKPIFFGRCLISVRPLNK